MKKRKLLRYGDWNGRDLFNYCLARSLEDKGRENDKKMFRVDIDNNEVADRILDVYALGEGNLYNALTERDIKKGISSITEILLLLSSSKLPADIVIEIQEHPSRYRDCIEEVIKLKKVVGELYQFLVCPRGNATE